MSKYALFLTVATLAAVPHGSWAQASAAPGLYATRYDGGGRVVGLIAPDPDGGGPLKFPATRMSYDAFGNLEKIEVGELAAWQSEAVSPSAWPGFTKSLTTEFKSDDLGRRIKQVVASGTSDELVTQYSYNYLSTGREECVATRMNRNVYQSLPTSACDLSAAGSEGPDRITRTEYDALDRVRLIQKALHTTREQDYVTYTYGSVSGDAAITRFGKPDTIKDAKGNVSGYEYSAPYQRVSKLYYPSANSVGVYNTADYEGYGYDANGNRNSYRKRDGRSFVLEYDALNRLKTKYVPDGCAPLQPTNCLPASQTRDVYYGYDFLGNRTYARFDSSTGEGVTQEYNGFGEQTSSTINMSGQARALGYTYDPHGTRKTLTFPDSVVIEYVYDGVDRIMTGKWSAPGVAQASFVTMTYNEAGLRKSVSHGLSATQYGYDAALRVRTLSQRFNDEYGDVNLTFDYNPASQVKTRATDNNAYEFLPQNGASPAYARNGLNQYTAVGGSSYQYDLNGNMTSDGVVAFGYDAENRLVSTSAGLSLVYDPMGRLYQTGGGGAATTRFLYDQEALVAEYDQSGNLQRRFIHGTQADEPLVWIEGGTLDCNNARFMHPDLQGSVVALSNCSGVRTAINTYDEFGYPGTSGQGRFRYTGQAWIPELSAYYYKARIYSPTLGRFYQPDPAGYTDSPNLYSYVANDPLNQVDPSGLASAALARMALQRAGQRYLADALISQVDSPAPGPADAVAAGLAVATTAGLIWDLGAAVLASEPFYTPDGREIAHGGRRTGPPQEYLKGKGWTPEQVDDVINNPDEDYKTTDNHRTGKKQRAYLDKDGNFVIVDSDGKVTAVGERGNKKYKKPDRVEEDEKKPEDKK